MQGNTSRVFSAPYATQSFNGNQVQYSLCENKVHAVQLASIGVCAVQNVTQDTARTMCRMADGLDSQDEEEEAEQSPSGSHPSPTPSHDPAAGSAQSVPVRSPHAAIREVDRATSRSIDQDIAAALAADAAFFEDPALSLGEGALQPLGGGHEEGYEQPALSAGGTVSKVQPPMPPSSLIITSSCVTMVFRDCLAKLNLPSVPAAMDVAAVISEQKAMTPQQAVKLFAQVVLIAFRRGSGQLQSTYSGSLPTGPAKHVCYQPCLLPDYGNV